MGGACKGTLGEALRNIAGERRGYNTLVPKQLSDHDVLILLVALPLFVAFARLCGEAAVRLRQPQVLGEVLAGLILGPSILGLISKPALHSMQHGAQLVEPFSWAGIILLLALTGMEM